jgi:biotin-dependent carboxylase-like uncharacterized protein
MSLEVLEAGLFDTVQDGGRPDWTHLGVPLGGACDRWSLVVANRLLDNPPAAAVLEMTLVGPLLAVRQATVVALAGADLGGVERPTGRRLVPGRSYRVEAGVTIAFPGATTGDARGYLALPGGIDVPAVLGSSSTLPAAGLGGLEGRALKAGDRLAWRGTGDAGGVIAGRVWPGPVSAPRESAGLLRVVRGPHAGRLGEAALETLTGTTWTVASASDRMGARLDGPSLDPAGGPALLSHGVVGGAIQVPPDGRPIVLLADHQTTGGYPVVAVVVAADLAAAGQLRPGSAVRFREVPLATARAALVAQRAAWDAASDALGEAGAWDELWRSAGG